MKDLRTGDRVDFGDVASRLLGGLLPSREATRLARRGLLRAHAEALRGALEAVEYEISRLDETPSDQAEKIVVSSS